MYRTAYKTLLQEFGPSHWWPARSEFEVIIGAILTQNTSWTNVEGAIDELRRVKLLSYRNLNKLNAQEIAPFIRKSGYFNLKADRLRCFLDWYGTVGGSVTRIRKKFDGDSEALRGALLEIRGIGPETADSILCYAFSLPYFTVDAYTMRWLSRYRPEESTNKYEMLRARVEKNFRKTCTQHDSLVTDFNEFHALIVRLGKDYCRKTKPHCKQCPLRRKCAQALGKH